MTVDLRAIVATDLGHCISGDVGTNHISDRSGLQMMSGRLQFEGIVTPPRGTPISFLVACPQRGTVTRFPHQLRVIRAVAHPQDRRSEIEVGCSLTLYKEYKVPEKYRLGNHLPSWYTSLSPTLRYFVEPPIVAQELLVYCLGKLGITLAANSRPLQFNKLRNLVDLSGGYVDMIGKLCRSECCYGRMLPDGTFQVVPMNLQTGGYGPVLTRGNWVSMEPITTGAEPADRYVVKYNAVIRGWRNDYGEIPPWLLGRKR